MVQIVGVLVYQQIVGVLVLLICVVLIWEQLGLRLLGSCSMLPFCIFALHEYVLLLLQLLLQVLLLLYVLRRRCRIQTVWRVVQVLLLHVPVLLTSRLPCIVQRPC
mmetsp:Transcript_4641/g.7567  ORF Transcript_4641/g.7567 Transcript_4641/m.7567 type:complete len:106 (-) Transcript_4641:1488-1805(-)